MYKIYSICYRDQKHTLKEPPPIQRLAFKGRKGGGASLPDSKACFERRQGCVRPRADSKVSAPAIQSLAFKGRQGGPRPSPIQSLAFKGRQGSVCSRNKGLLSSDLRGHSSPIQKLFFSRDASGDAPSAPNSKPCFQETPGGCTFCLSAKTHVFETLKQTCNAMHGLILRKFEAKYSRVRHSFWSQICRHVKPETWAHVLSPSMDVWDGEKGFDRNPCRWLYKCFYFHSHPLGIGFFFSFLKTFRFKKLQVLKDWERIIILSLSYYHYYIIIIILSVSYYHYHIIVIILSLLYYHYHIISIILSLSYYHYHIIIIILSAFKPNFLFHLENIFILIIIFFPIDLERKLSWNSVTIINLWSIFSIQ